MTSPPSQKAQSEPVTQPLPVTTRIYSFLILWALKIASTAAFKILRGLSPTPKELRPLIKSYPCRPALRHRIFIPSSYQTGTLPLYIDIHGGGFALCDAQFDDEFCYDFANTFKVLVVSVEYALAPANKFPGPTNDVVAIALAIMNDPSLPVDTKRIVLGGFSAGGNLALSAGQSLDLRGKIHGVVSWYPVTDFTLDLKEKQMSRPYRNAKDTDVLGDYTPVFDWGYIPRGQFLKDPRLSVRYAGPKTCLPKWIYVIGAQYDMLANEARECIFDIASLEAEERQSGREGFEKDTYKWTLVKGVRHGFTHQTGDCKGEDEIMRTTKRQEMMHAVAEWLFNGPFSIASPMPEGSKAYAS
ncbi:hypothetical protein BP6252_10543 [Coleophoma cylindrospora]|uniref:Alpha/beta hydrolase fold-3 domain-containing protein n=1 Tax=Coleophoma cylindrospora TaxID=1849047 RepID=A0A3D8QSY9_9HELO|nr:hypothetical protein BP6252_10543 [Coleophoma cylindrospora]